MSADQSPFVIKHSLVTAQKGAEDGTQTFYHDSNGSTRFGIAVRFQLENANDKLSILIGMKVPGASSNSGDDDYFADHRHYTDSIGGISSTANNKFSTLGSPQQHVISVGPWWATPGDWVITYTWDTNTADAADLLAVTSWTLRPY